jgi:alanine racemase
MSGLVVWLLMTTDWAKIDSANCWVEIDGRALAWNVGRLKGLAGEGRLLMAVVKANAYGHGMIETASLALDAGADWLGVFSAAEGLVLRDAGIRAPVLVFGPVARSQIKAAFEAGLRLTVSSIPAAKEIAELALRGGAVHLKVETGTNRQGLQAGELAEALDILGNSRAAIEGAYTHFADIEDTTDHRYAESQLKRFEEALDKLRGLKASIHIAHTACSAATILFPSTYFNMVRVGIALFGLWPSKETLVSAKSLGRNALDLRPVMTWKTRIAQVKSLGAGEFVGYGRTYKTTRPSRIAVIPVGYADGYDRRLSNACHVLVRGTRAPIRGRVCMNLAMADVSDIADAAPGDEVVLLGRQGDETIGADDLARHIGTINYEVVTRVAPAAPRIVV